MKKLIALILIAMNGVSCMIKPPIAPKRPHLLEKHGDKRTDNYFWLKERENPEVISYLNQENDYLKKIMKDTEPLQETLFHEMKNRIKEDSSSAPYQFKDYFYYYRFEVGFEYPIFARKYKSLEASEETIINVNELAKGQNYFSVPGIKISPDQKIVAFPVDNVGRRFYTIYFKDLSTGKTLDQKIENVTSNFVWSEDNDYLFYSQQNPDTLRSEKIFRYQLSKNKSELIYFEKDDTYSVEVYKSLTRNFIYIMSASTLTTEVQYLNAHQPTGKFKIFAKREREHEYSVTDDDKGFYIISNLNAKNKRVLFTSFDKIESKNWKEVIPHNEKIYIDDILVFKNYLIIQERELGQTRFRVITKDFKNSHLIEFQDPTYSISIAENTDFNSTMFRYDYESLRQPSSIYDYDLKNQNSILIKMKEVPTYNSENYISEKIWATAKDGTKVPISILMKKGTPKDGSAPLLLYGYGSYGISLDPWFSGSTISLLDRGFIYAIAHIRGGGELGRTWTDQGRTLQKLNTFNDFNVCAEYLINQKYAHPNKLFAMGGSAGGLLMGAISNLRPDLYKGIVAQVAFVDVLTTMLDESIPLTTGEYDEWGNPNEKQNYDYIKTYSPYDNVSAKNYPNILATTGLHDSQVQYWEPAKWVAKLREFKTNDSLILLHTDMESGHGGKSGRYDHLKEVALEYAFILKINNL